MKAHTGKEILFDIAEDNEQKQNLKCNMAPHLQETKYPYSLKDLKT